MRLASAAVLAALTAFAVGCAGTLPLDASSQVPAAKGEAKVKLDKNGHSHVDLRVEHLAPPERLTPSRRGYFLWAESNYGRIALLGPLRIDEKRRARWEGTVPFDHFRLLVSAEDLISPPQPTPPFLLQTELYDAKDEGWF